MTMVDSIVDQVLEVRQWVGSTDAGKLPSDTERTEGNKIDDRETRKSNPS